MRASEIRAMHPDATILGGKAGGKGIKVPKHMLSARQVQVAREGDSHDGEGLILRVQKKAVSWVLRYRVASGKRRELGLGAVDRSNIEAAGASLTGARELADQARDQLVPGVRDPDRCPHERSADRAVDRVRQAGADLDHSGRVRNEGARQ